MKIQKWVLVLFVIGLTGTLRAETGKVTLVGTSTSTVVSGVALLWDTPQGLKIDADITQAPAGLHGLHIHEFGLCDEQGKAAGGHYNPAGHPHGNTLKDGIAKTHAGDFANVTIDKTGKGSLHIVVPGLALSQGPTPVAGHALVLHEKADDFSQPTGNAGGRIGCGAIVITGK